MEVILSDGWGIQLTPKGMRRYLEKAKLDGFLYYWSGEENAEYTRMDDDDRYEYGAPGVYHVVAGDLGKYTTHQKVYDNILIDQDCFSRTDQILIDALKELKDEADNRLSLSIATIPDDIEWRIDIDDEYMHEWVVEGPPPRKWYGKPLQ